MIWARVRHGGPWARLLPGVVMLRNGTPTRQQEIAAALRYAGAGAVVTGLSAAQLHGLRKFPPPDQVHVLIPHDRKRISTGFTLVERTTRYPATIVGQGFPTAEISRAVLDAVRRMSKRDQVEALIAEAVQRGWTTPRRLREELEAGSDRGSALPRSCLGAIDEGARSTAEARGVALAKRSGLPPMRWNVRLRTPAGLILPSPDGWVDEVCMAWEIDSYEHHLSPADYRRTLERHNIMTAHGIVVVRTLPSQLITRPEVVIGQLRDSYRRAAERPRPDIIAG
ncbi:MAG: type IV toxin-antitoxin system AbiEi family antitoxin [Thermocrispum sp.]